VRWLCIEKGGVRVGSEWMSVRGGRRGWGGVCESVGIDQYGHMHASCVVGLFEALRLCGHAGGGRGDLGCLEREWRLRHSCLCLPQGGWVGRCMGWQVVILFLVGWRQSMIAI
jgi:hypothetical protein